jgi:hypothetical protein
MYNVYGRGLDLAHRDTGRRKKRQGNRLEEEKGKRTKKKQRHIHLHHAGRMGNELLGGVYAYYWDEVP